MTTSRTKSTSKKDQLIRLLGVKSGRDIKTLSQQLGWQAHTIRAAISGLRKAGYEVRCDKQISGGSRYRIVSAGPSEGLSAAEAS